MGTPAQNRAGKANAISAWEKRPKCPWCGKKHNQHFYRQRCVQRAAQRNSKVGKVS